MKGYNPYKPMHYAAGEALAMALTAYPGVCEAQTTTSYFTRDLTTGRGEWKSGKSPIAVSVVFDMSTGITVKFKTITGRQLPTKVRYTEL